LASLKRRVEALKWHPVSFRIVHVSKEENKEADRLCNKAVRIARAEKDPSAFSTSAAPEAW